MASVGKLGTHPTPLNVKLEPTTPGSSYRCVSEDVEGSAANPNGFSNGLAMDGGTQVRFGE
jgi:hypothetical protein